MLRGYRFDGAGFLISTPFGRLEATVAVMSPMPAVSPGAFVRDGGVERLCNAEWSAGGVL